MASSRDPISRRSSYEAQYPVERYIVALLNEALEENLSKLLEPTSSNSVRTALDVGCGGQPLRSHVETAKWEYESFDLASTKEIKLDHVGLIDTDLPPSLHERTFDLILCTEVLEHVADWDQAFQNLSSLLSPGGHLLVTVPHFYIPHEEPYDFWRPTSHAIRHWAEAHGLTVEKEERLGSGWDVLGTLLEVLPAWTPNRRPFALFYGTLSRLLLRLLRFLLRRGYTQQGTDCLSPLYMSTLAILRKP